MIINCRFGMSWYPLYGSFGTDVYHKPTGTHQYLNFGFCHPPHVKRGIPYSQALRVRKICDSDYVCETRVNELKSFLLKRGYKRDFIDAQIDRVKNVDRLPLLEGEGIHGSEGSSRVVLNLDYHPALLDVHRILREL